MIDPFLYTSLQFHFVQPIDIIGSCFIVRRFFDQFVQFFLRIVFFSIKTIYLHPSFEVMMENCVFFPAVPYFIDKTWIDRKSTRLNSSHVAISYAVFCLKKKTLYTHFYATI